MQSTQPTISEILGYYRPLIAKQSRDFQLKLLWLLLEAVAAETDQLKAYVDALHVSFMHYAGAVETYSTANAQRADKLKIDLEELTKEFD